ncbi:ParB N-terminal domain-containing protein [Sphingopyxis sp. BSN-002]|uniref:plasmid partitioning protein RepB C-terminal domain-containing protein n=1 Tax=Sphingopyxis sp. BSN-002 TaxID=2911495 RepID=UPI001EDA6390|nr:plasmid partitioning protein RepB C-terminal domain-containing protein [Sphingopyxis sp. BSN-002]UKK86153.1 ParB N-terminal domain-containing protein [Sphingopyxis sp. BSN-002]
MAPIEHMGHLSKRRVHAAFDRDFVTLPVDAIIALKTLRPEFRESRKYVQIVTSIKAVGLVESPVVVSASDGSGQYYLLDGHMRIEALKDLGIPTVDCLIATDEDTYTYNKRISRLPPVQEHRMIVRTVERGVDPTEIAEALGLEVQTIVKRFRLLDGISAEVAGLLKDTTCSMKVFDILRRMSPMRQVEAASLMIGQNVFTPVFAKALLAATPDEQLARPRRSGRIPSPNGQQLARMERELAVLQTRIKSVEDSFGVDVLHLTLARGFMVKLLANNGVVRWLANNRQDYLAEFQRVAEIEALQPGLDAQPP